MVDEPDAFSPEASELFLPSNLTALGEKCHPVCVGMTWRRLIAAGTMREWRPRMEELNLEARQYGVGVLGGVEHAALRARIHHEAGNWIIQKDASNAFNSVFRKPMLYSYHTCTRTYLKDTLHKYVVQSIPNAVQSEPMSFNTCR